LDGTALERCVQQLLDPDVRTRRAALELVQVQQAAIHVLGRLQLHACPCGLLTGCDATIQSGHASVV
jgi:hypothetical protein